MLSPCIQEDEFEIEAGSEHEHVVEHLDLGDGAGGQGVPDGHEPDVLVAAVVRRDVHRVLLDLQVAAAVDHLATEQQRSNAISLCVL